MAESHYALEPKDLDSPDIAFERNFALTLLEQVLKRLETEQFTAGKAVLFKLLQTTLMADPDAPSYACLAHKTGMSEEALRMVIYRMRRRYRDLLRDEIAQTVSSPEEVDPLPANANGRPATEGIDVRASAGARAAPEGRRSSGLRALRSCGRLHADGQVLHILGVDQPEFALGDAANADCRAQLGQLLGELAVLRRDTALLTRDCLGGDRLLHHGEADGNPPDGKHREARDEDDEGTHEAPATDGLGSDGHALLPHR